MISYMDARIDPCLNPYDWACGNYPTKHFPKGDVEYKDMLEEMDFILQATLRRETHKSISSFYRK